LPTNDKSAISDKKDNTIDAVILSVFLMQEVT
jgi:hypothetical protein